MPDHASRDLFALRILTVASLAFSAIVGLVAWEWHHTTRLGEVTVERINVVDGDGKLRLVISNKDRLPEIVVGGKTFTRQGTPTPGLLFYNDEGDEDGGLTFEGRNGSANASLTFDQYRQDQTLGLQYAEEKGQRVVGLFAWDRSSTPSSQLTDRGAERLFVGKRLDDALVTMSDAAGRQRLRLKVESSGAASIEFLDESGNVTRRIRPS
jgi:hypothetical protein